MEATGFFLLGSTAWFGAFFGPMALGTWFWYTAAARYPKWVVHTLFAPTVFALEWAMVALVSFASHDDGDGPPGLGLVFLFPFACFIGTVVIYYVAVSWTILRFVWRSINGR